MESNLDKVISVCTSRDIDVWRIAAPQICKNIRASSYVVIVPDRELDLFRAASPKSYNVVAESFYADTLNPLLLKYMPPATSPRRGWYLQQFIKIMALAEIKNGVALVWDADTIPVKPLNFFGACDKLIYYESNEVHQPYFTLIEKILGFLPPPNFSFIAQCFVARGIWVSEFCRAVETHLQLPWYEAIISQIDFTENSGFSEYETLGSFFMRHHSDEMMVSNAKWERLGGSRYGHVKRLTEQQINEMAKHFDFVNFESWDKPSVFNKLKYYLKRM